MVFSEFTVTLNNFTIIFGGFFMILNLFVSILNDFIIILNDLMFFISQSITYIFDIFMNKYANFLYMHDGYSSDISLGNNRLKNLHFNLIGQGDPEYNTPIQGHPQGGPRLPPNNQARSEWFNRPRGLRVLILEYEWRGLPAKALSGPGFSLYEGVWTIQDPTGVGARGYLDPLTGRPYLGSCQPYAKNLSKAMEYVVEGGGLNQKFEPFNEEAKRFFTEFMKFHHPDRSTAYYRNYYHVREAIRSLP
jgi:hypothetical protein